MNSRNQIESNEQSVKISYHAGGHQYIYTSSACTQLTLSACTQDYCTANSACIQTLSLHMLGKAVKHVIPLYSLQSSERQDAVYMYQLMSVSECGL